MKHYINESGTDIILDTGVLIGSAADQSIWFRKPDGVTTGSFAADLYDSYSSIATATGTYFVKHTLAYAELDTAGEWRLQAYVASIAGTWLGEMVKLQVYDSFE